MRAFSGHFPPTQLLYLWDLIIAYDSLELLPLLAASILSFRKERRGLNLFLKLFLQKYLPLVFFMQYQKKGEKFFLPFKHLPCLLK